MANRRYDILVQDIGLLSFLITMVAGLIILYAGRSALLVENSVMLFITIVAIIIVTFSLDFSAFIMVAAQIICFTAYKLFALYQYGTVISSYSFAWLVLPIAAVGSMRLFIAGRNRLELENSILRQQVEELVMIDPLTGLYNLRSFYYDIDRQIRYTRRNKLPLTLMIIRLRYAEELKKILSKRNFDKLKQRFAEIIGDAIRLEDNQYSIDNEGGLAIILTCDEAGGQLVKNRIKFMVGEKDAFDGITDSSIKVEVQIAYVQYRDEMENDAAYYKQSVERELQYDV